VRERFKRRWSGEGGIREVLLVAYPLVLSQMSFTVQMFVDRLFLTWYSQEAVAGAVMGIFTTWSLIALFLHTAEYLTTFVAQYFGAGRPERIGRAVWQGIYFSALAGVLVALLIPFAGPFFEMAGHEPVVRGYETTYSRILMAGCCPIVLMAALSTFFAGRGETLVVLRVNVLVTAVNVVLNYLWIFGHAGFPRAGVAGAAWSTVVSQVVGAAAFFALILRPEHRATFRTLSGWRPDPALFLRLLRFGLPAGLQYSLEVLAFALFMLIVGRIGTPELAASGIAFNLNMIVFMPMLGLGLGLSSVVGRYLGAGRPDVAERSTWSAFVLAMSYMTACGALYVFTPGLLLAPYAAGADPATFPALAAITTVLLRFVALYSIFDMMNVVFASGLRGAGDTAYPLWISLVLQWSLMLAPTYVACVLQGRGVYAAWTAASAYVIVLGALLLRRFAAGRWKSLRVIEPGLAERAGPSTGAEPA
jgi:MATE family multidrug resistance protein